MAYLRETDRQCGCGKRASVELVNQFNGVMGHYCKTCGAREWKRLQKEESANR